MRKSHLPLELLSEANRWNLIRADQLQWKRSGAQSHSEQWWVAQKPIRLVILRNMHGIATAMRVLWNKDGPLNLKAKCFCGWIEIKTKSTKNTTIISNRFAHFEKKNGLLLSYAFCGFVFVQTFWRNAFIKWLLVCSFSMVFHCCSWSRSLYNCANENIMSLKLMAQKHIKNLGQKIIGLMPFYVTIFFIFPKCNRRSTTQHRKSFAPCFFTVWFH